MTSLSIIILSYNTKKLTLQCLDSVFLHYGEQLENGDFEIVVVDNGSTDATASEISSIKQLSSIRPFGLAQVFDSEAQTRGGGQAQDKSIKLIVNKENFGFSKGINIGASEARGKYLFFLNSDTRIKDNKLTEMVKFMEEHKEVGILGARMINEDGSNQLSAGKFYNLFNFFLMIAGGERLGMIRSGHNNVEQVDWVSGGSMMIRSKIFKDIKGFDEALFMYIEDMELCYRAKKIGFLTFYYPSIEIVHKGVGSSSREYAILSIYKGISYFFKKHKSPWEHFIVLRILKLKAVFAFFVGTIKGDLSLKNTYKKALGAKL